MTHDPTDLPDVHEYGLERDGERQKSARRLFMQLLVLESGGEPGIFDAQRALIGALERRGTPAVVYEDMNNPAGVGLLSFSENPSRLLEQVRAVVAEQVPNLRVRTEFTMLGRSYSSGFEPDLDYWLLKRPRETVLNEKWPWAIWYPLRRNGDFEKLDGRSKSDVMREHAAIGKAYGKADLAHDIRLACHGLDTNDNDFVIGLIGSELYPLSHVVQAMRRTRQTREFMDHLGPFFVGRVIWRNAGRE